VTGPEHYRRAEDVAGEAHRLPGQETARPLRASGPPWPRPHAVLALAAATAVGASGADSRAWADAAGTGFGAGHGDH
jgi:hypothetical protein